MTRIVKLSVSICVIRGKTIYILSFEVIMNTKVDMTYRFLWDSEPTDEQLQVIMEEVAEEARLRQEEVIRQVIENIQRESARCHSALKGQQI